VVNQLENRIGAHKTIALSLTIISIMCFLNASETRVFWNAVQMFTIGFNHNIIGVLGQVQIMNIHTTSLNSWLQTLHFGFGVGSSLSPLLISAIGLKAIFFYGILTMVLAIVIVR
jgi:predicted MFS family arabinose efflux permease